MTKNEVFGADMVTLPKCKILKESRNNYIGKSKTIEKGKERMKSSRAKKREIIMELFLCQTLYLLLQTFFVQEQKKQNKKRNKNKLSY